MPFAHHPNFNFPRVRPAVRVGFALMHAGTIAMRIGMFGVRAFIGGFILVLILLNVFLRVFTRT